MIAQDTASQPVISDRELRRHIDRSVSRALVDGEYARLLLIDPTVVLEDQECPPQQYLSLLSIQADTLLDFARQAQALFWAVAHYKPELVEEDAPPLAAAAR
jgi:putative NADH-flavin reductase